jgi:1,4-dihydroxy-2-naphthoate octaprenyltransferase
VAGERERVGHVSLARKLLIGARPRTLVLAASAVAAPVVAEANGPRSGQAGFWLKGLGCLAVAVLLQVGVNYANDYFDGVKGVDARRKGPTRLVAAGLMSASAVRGIALASLASAAILGVVVAVFSTPWLIAVGGVGLLAAWSYSGEPFSYGYKGLGELVVFAFFGPAAVLGTDLALTGGVHGTMAVVAAAAGAASSAVLLVNNLRDLESDAASGKRTLAVILGREASLVLYRVLVAVPVVAVAGLCLLSLSPWPLLGALCGLPAGAALRLSSMRPTPYRSLFAASLAVCPSFCLPAAFGLLAWRLW